MQYFAFKSMQRALSLAIAASLIWSTPAWACKDLFRGLLTELFLKDQHQQATFEELYKIAEETYRDMINEIPSVRRAEFEKKLLTTVAVGERLNEKNTDRGQAVYDATTYELIQTRLRRDLLSSSTGFATLLHEFRHQIDVELYSNRNFFLQAYARIFGLGLSTKRLEKRAFEVNHRFLTQAIERVGLEPLLAFENIVVPDLATARLLQYIVLSSSLRNGDLLVRRSQLEAFAAKDELLAQHVVGPDGKIVRARLDAFMRRANNHMTANISTLLEVRDSSVPNYVAGRLEAYSKKIKTEERARILWNTAYFGTVAVLGYYFVTALGDE